MEQRDHDMGGFEPRYSPPGTWQAVPVRDGLRHRPSQPGVVGREAGRQVLLHRSRTARAK